MLLFLVAVAAVVNSSSVFGLRVSLLRDGCSSEFADGVISLVFLNTNAFVGVVVSLPMSWKGVVPFAVCWLEEMHVGSFCLVLPVHSEA